jgi:hypothetical protein
MFKWAVDHALSVRFGTRVDYEVHVQCETTQRRKYGRPKEAENLLEELIEVELPMLHVDVQLGDQDRTQRDVCWGRERRGALVSWVVWLRVSNLPIVVDPDIW